MVSADDVMVTDFARVLAVGVPTLAWAIQPGPVSETTILPVTEFPVTFFVSDELLKIPNM